MESHWYHVAFVCPSCNQTPMLQSIEYAADSEFRFMAWCPTCKKLVGWNAFASQLAHRALMFDIQRSQPEPKLLTEPEFNEAEFNQFFNKEGGGEHPPH